ncbi:type III secretion system export apparatus subunit SctV [Criblamydia sequanensis]|uniref:Type III secretion inner membrane protein SctV n=1 Tax=Candidatus Criblamydia sequanensis CRIB-18 TaxID=1437425 RepID=A0A090CZ56_9BACT|nr:type III secretion system export apparatus subunit SctV [Criblamydia sequanensis]CDR34021.1 Type III secretion inner membrane protein SctV [Criblamydia sequanensis CRIB-18]
MFQTLKKILDGIAARLAGESGAINRSSDVALAIVIIAILAMIIIPVPPYVIDYLIALNLTISVMLLMVALYIPSALQLSIFPSLLLITTLYRLGLNIASTRQILLRGDAGEIIFQFGNFVIGGNFVVGGIIFLIITLVNFIVITKGAERVAEVAARFTLDAMPGKQMSIDADMRAGILDSNQAREKRLTIQKESQLYGAMDGAMKFVKGDAIAGIVITIINVIGGIIIGMTMYGMDAMQSVQKYSVLSIGDGLVSQIPALLISITAGIVTTRVTSDKGDISLGSEISGQLFKQPKALLIASAFLMGMGILPGFPTAPFMILSACLALIGYALWTSEDESAVATDGSGMMSSGGSTISSSKGGPPKTTKKTGVPEHQVISGGGIDNYALTLPVIIECGAGLSDEIREAQKVKGASFVDAMIPKMRQALYADLGVRFPGVHVRTDSPILEPDEYSIHLNEVPVVRGKVLKGFVLTNENEENLSRYNLTFTSYKNSLGLPSLWVEEKYVELLNNAGIKQWRSLEVMILHLSYFFRHYANEFVGIQEVKSMLEFMEKSFPDLVKEVTRLIPLQKMTDIFKRLIQEQISIKDLRTILESLSEWAQTEKDTVLLTEYVRSSLKRYISYKYSQGQSVLSVYILDPEIEDMVRGAIKQTSAGSYLALDPDSVQLILQGVRSTVAPPPPGGQPPVILTAIDVRRFVRKLIEMEFTDISVVSYQEIIPEIRIQPLGRIQIS